MYSYGPPHMAVQKQDDQHEHTFSNYVRIRDVVQKTCLRRWTIGKSGERGSGISVLPARHDDDDDLAEEGPEIYARVIQKKIFYRRGTEYISKCYSIIRGKLFSWRRTWDICKGGFNKKKKNIDEAPNIYLSVIQWKRDFFLQRRDLIYIWRSFNKERVFFSERQSPNFICKGYSINKISDVLLWTPTHGRAKAGRPARTYIQQLCEDTGCCPEDLPRAMNDREE